MATRRNEDMSTRTKLLIGGLGGVAPVLINLVVIDLQTLLLDLTLLAAISYCVRVVALFAIGGIVAVLNKTENNPFKVFQLGIAAPALITAAINGSHVTIPEQPSPHAAATGSGHRIALISSAFAQPDQQEIKQFTLPKETAIQQITRGLIGSTPSNVWFVIAGSHLKKEDAEAQAAKIRAKGFAADVYAPYGDNPYYAVVIGAQLTRTEAQELRMKAINAGLPQDTYLWTFPRK